MSKLEAQQITIKHLADAAAKATFEAKEALARPAQFNDATQLQIAYIKGLGDGALQPSRQVNSKEKS